MTLHYFLILFISSLAFGCTVGAYFTTAEYRIRQGMPLITRDCICPACGHRLSALHQIPIVSFLLLGGRCRYCKAPIPLRYPLIEAGFLLFYGLSFLAFWNHPPLLLCLWGLFASALLLIRCRAHPAGLLKGLSLFLLYHAAYGAILLSILAALGV